MQQLKPTFNGEPLTMSSQEIADILGCRHDAVKRTIGRLSTDKVDGNGRVTKPAVMALPPLVETSFQDLSGRTQWTTEYRVGQRDSYIVVAQLSPAFTAKLVDRWQELEQQSANDAVPKSLPEALRLAADLAEKNEQLTLVARQQGDRIKALQNLFEGGLTPPEFAKRLNGLNCQKINAALARRGWLYKDGFGCWRVSSKARDLYLTERSGRVERSDGQAMVTATPVLLQRGAALLHKLYLHEQLPMKKTWNGVFTHDKPAGEGA